MSLRAERSFTDNLDELRIAMIMYTPTSEQPNSEGAGVVLKPKKKRKFPLRDVEHRDRRSPIHPAKAMKVMRRKY